MTFAVRCHLTVLICTLNREQYLQRTLAALEDMDTPPGLRWEVLVVDNASSDGTFEMVRTYDFAQSEVELRLMTERSQGVGLARKTGYQNCRGEWIALIDDDCLVAPDWLSAWWRFIRNHRQAGVVGGGNELLWEEEPPPVAELYGESLARQDLGATEKRLPQYGRQVLCGAGLVVKKALIEKSGFVDRAQLKGRSAKNMAAGEDAELVLFARSAGGQVWYNPHQRLRHRIPANRTTIGYLCRLHQGFGQVEPYLVNLSQGKPPVLKNRIQTLIDALRELGSVVGRFPKGFVLYKNERPTWVIRVFYVFGYLQGSFYYIFKGRPI